MVTVDTADNAEEIMQKAMQEPIFVEFADACLKVVDPENAAEEEHKQDWLNFYMYLFYYSHFSKPTFKLLESRTSDITCINNHSNDEIISNTLL